MLKGRALPPTYLYGALALMLALHFLAPGAVLTKSPWRFLGAAPLAAGAVLNIWSSRLFEREGTTVKPFKDSRVLVVRGPYRISRHPMYLGMALVLAGLAAIAGTLSPVFVVIAFIAAMELKFIRTEERMLEERFGEEYREYKKRVRRWI